MIEPFPFVRGRVAFQLREGTIQSSALIKKNLVDTRKGDHVRILMLRQVVYRA